MNKVKKKKRCKVILSVAGSDNSAGAGVQCDIKVASALNVYCVNCITTVTSQDSNGVKKIFELPKEMILSQLKTILNEFKVDGIKIGLISNIKSAESIVTLLKKKFNNIPIVVDPIHKSTTNSLLVSKYDYLIINKILSKLGPIFTPNLTEIKTLLNLKNMDKIPKEKLIKNFHDEYKSKVVLTLGDESKSICEDFFLDEKLKVRSIKSKKIVTKNSHGTGCTFSTALCVNLINKKNLHDSVVSAKKFTEKSLVLAPKLGLKYGPVGHRLFFR